MTISPISTKTITATLSEREQRYGSFTTHSEIAQNLKQPMYDTVNWSKLSSTQKEALEMVQHKVARILNGDPNYEDNWHDLSGYATLGEKDCKLNKEPIRKRVPLDPS